ncbi:gamma-glutamyltransferase [Lyngbya confervoides]|uniref:Gamma-glutamyltransferase family protein n=1 Tax=Lyngbya confervoides BDU141951 TaxID=1574623 RepID=A0ABD4SZB9_9CYAN|nr:gamma-glutamyltransferase [Lyngbya confervoides]MCM1981649.1 gamma-glutamyltransferase family protein [Lyngbya confervoides BDU141951]
MVRVAIAAGSQIAADAGAAMATQGGNAVDAALAAALVSMSTDLGVMALGASGFITLWPAGSAPVVIDAYAEMPGREARPGSLGQSSTEVWFNYGGGIRNIVGHGTVATPGIFKGLGMASEQYGQLPWATVVEPALTWASRGFPLTGGAAEYLAHTHEAIFGWHPSSYAALHHPDGRCLQAGETVHIPGLARSLQEIAVQGASTMYTGDLGQRIAAEIQAHGGLLSATDLAAYEAIARSPITIRCGPWRIATNPPPAIGGACLGAMLLLRDRPPILSWDTGAIQAWITIQQAVLDYRSQCLDGVIDNAAEVQRLLDLARQGHLSLQSPSTIHISTVDSEGLACSISASAGYGSGVLVPDTGIWLNNSLGEVDLHPQGLQELSPGDRLSSNMAPTVARHDDGTVLAIGSPGASRITTAIAQVLSNYIHLHMSLEEAIDHPRIHIEQFEGVPAIALENRLRIEAVQGWKLRYFPGHSMYFGGVQAAQMQVNGKLNAVADPRRTGGIAVTPAENSRSGDAPRMT